MPAPPRCDRGDDLETAPGFGIEVRLRQGGVISANPVIDLDAERQRP